MKRRIPSSSTASALGTSPVLLRGFQHFESQTMTCCCSLRLLYKVHAIELDLQSRLHQAVLFSHYSSTELSKERLFLVEIQQSAVFPPSRCLIFSIHFIALSIILQSLSLCIFTKISWSTINLKTEMALGL